TQYAVDEPPGRNVQLAVEVGGGLERVLDRGPAAVLRLHLHPAQPVLRVQPGADLPAAAPPLDVRVPGGQLRGVEVRAEVARRTASRQVEDPVAVGEGGHEGAGAVEGQQVLAVGAVLEGRGGLDLGERGTAQRGQAERGGEGRGGGETGRGDGEGRCRGGREGGRRGHATVTRSRGSGSRSGVIIGSAGASAG